jgi:D-amino-acid oxidase
VLVDMPRYLVCLERRLTEAGGRIDSGWVGSLTDVAGVAGLVVNCTGLAARQLVSDTSLTSMRGQLVVVENPGVDWFFQDQAEEGDLTYFLPHGKRVVLGGSAIAAAEHTTVDHTIAAAIVERCARVEPRLRDATVVQNRVGLRPNRPSVRLECEESLGFPVIHNYGHGGSGMTLSWGCAADVLRLARDLLG